MTAFSNLQLELLKQDTEKLKETLEKTEEERDLAVKNYNTLCSQVRQPVMYYN